MTESEIKAIEERCGDALEDGYPKTLCRIIRNDIPALIAALREARREALEEAAAKCDELLAETRVVCEGRNVGVETGLQDGAEAIRALAEKEVSRD